MSSLLCAVTVTPLLYPLELMGQGTATPVHPDAAASQPPTEGHKGKYYVYVPDHTDTTFSPLHTEGYP